MTLEVHDNQKILGQRAGPGGNKTTFLFAAKTATYAARYPLAVCARRARAAMALSKLCADEHGIILGQLCNALEPHTGIVPVHYSRVRDSRNGDLAGGSCSARGGINPGQGRRSESS